MRFLLALILAAALTGCGFHLRGSESARLPYDKMYISLPDTSEVSIWLQRYIRSSQSTQIVDDAKQADAIFQQVSDNRVKSILSVNAQGRVREYRLQLNYTFRIINSKGQELIAPSELNLTRDLSYDDSSVLSKGMEEQLLWRDMTNELVSQIVRRLSIVKPKNPDLEEDDE